MALARWKKLTEEIVFRNQWWTYKRDAFELPSGKVGEYNYVSTNGSAMVIPVTGDGHFLLVNQYRYLLERESIEFPCGSVKEGATYEDTARLELQEETGYACGRLLLVGQFNPYNGVTNEMCNVYIARDLRAVSSVPDDTEEFEVLTVTADEIDDWIRRGRIWDGMTIAAWHIARMVAR